MKILLFHPADDPLEQYWTGEKWDAVFDLGWAGEESYCRWKQELNCPVASLAKLEVDDFRRIRESLAHGSEFLLDEHALDWWELMIIEFHQQLQELARLQKFAARLTPNDEVFITRDCFQARALELIGTLRVRRLASGSTLWRRARRYATALRSLTKSQMLEIAGDKYDTGYRLRRRIAGRPAASSRAVVLLPSAYGNVTRTELQYAQTLPDMDFLLVTTRSSGRPANTPNNVSVENLASYVNARTSRAETESLLTRWDQLKRHLESHPLFSLLIGCGSLQHIPMLLRHGLIVRDAWLNVFERQPVSAVLCADDANRFTQLPLLLAEKRGLPAIACHHGALDGRHRIRLNCHYPFLVKGQMEYDYMVRGCGVPAERIEIGAPRRPESFLPRPAQRKGSLVFFSEPYEVSGGRCREFYGEILPRLKQVAADVGCRLLVKLHPFESRRERERMVRAVLGSSEAAGVQFASGLLTDHLLNDTLCAVTILSTTAVECVQRGIPVFLCEWLNYSDYGYLQQFAKFGAGIALQSADELKDIPMRLNTVPAVQVDDLCNPIAPDRLRSLLTGCKTMAVAV